MEELLGAAETFVQRALCNNDASHDMWHITRVRTLAKRLAEEELLSPSRVQLVELCALLHDVDDWKYASTLGQGNQGKGKGGAVHTAPPAEHEAPLPLDVGQESAHARDVPHVEKCASASKQGNRVKKFLEDHGCSEALVEEVTFIISSIGFKEHLPSASSSGQEHASKPKMSLEAQVLQDADRLDAIGAIGIARCFTFGGAFKRVLHDPTLPPRVGLTKEQYMDGAGKEHNTTINHFHEKLLLLKDLMNTSAGRRLAERRHAFVHEYLQQFVQEWEGHI